MCHIDVALASQAAWCPSIDKGLHPHKSPLIIIHQSWFFLLAFVRISNTYFSTFISHLWKLDKFTNSNVLCFDLILIFLVKHSWYINRKCNSQINWLNLTLKSIFSYQGFNPSWHTAFDINLPLPWNVLKRKRNRLQTWEDY